MERNVVGAHEGGGCTPIIWQEGTPGIMMRCGTKTGEYLHRAAVQGCEVAAMMAQSRSWNVNRNGEQRRGIFASS